MAIEGALEGRDPDSRVWGFIGASDFLGVVQDVTTWALSNFESFHARPEAENLPNGVRIAAGFYFTMMPRHLLPFASGHSVRTLRKTAEPGLRAAVIGTLTASAKATVGAAIARLAIRIIRRH